jgi:DNA repair ATPase RecN
VIIEEIDNGVHPSRAENLVRQIQEVGRARNLRVLVTTHNPALLDALPNNALGDVLCCYRDPDVGDSRIVRLGDIKRFPDLVAQASLGELVTTRVLDRFLKDKTTEEERTQKSLEWLEQLKKEVAE